MYIRRKVFSVVNVDGEERLFSVKEKNSKEESGKKKSHTVGKVALGGLAGIYGASAAAGTGGLAGSLYNAGKNGIKTKHHLDHAKYLHKNRNIVGHEADLEIDAFIKDHMNSAKKYNRYKQSNLKLAKKLALPTLVATGVTAAAISGIKHLNKKDKKNEEKH